MERRGEQDTDIGGVLTPGDDRFFGAVAGASAVVRLGKYCPVLMCVYYTRCTELGLVGWADRDCATDAGWRLARQARRGLVRE